MTETWDKLQADSYSNGLLTFKTQVLGLFRAGIDGTMPPDTISGTVTGAIQAGVTVKIYILSCGLPQPYETVITDAQGYYAIGDLPNGRYLVGPEAVGYSFSNFKWVDIPQTEIQSYDFTATSITP